MDLLNNPANSKPLENKTVLITGASSGIGLVAARKLAGQGARVVMVCRNAEKGERAKNEIVTSTGNPNITVLLADLSIMQEVRRVATLFKEQFPKLDVLINNAGMMPGKRKLTPEGLEISWATNYLSAFLLTNLLLDELLAAGDARVINISSEAHRIGQINFQEMHKAGKYSAITAYADSILAMIFFTYELARRLELTGITVNCLHPGVVATNFAQQEHTAIKYLFMIGRPFFRSAEKGAENTVFLASSPEVAGVTGAYFKNFKPVKTSGQTYNLSIARRLWTLSEKQTGFNA